LIALLWKACEDVPGVAILYKYLLLSGVLRHKMGKKGLPVRVLLAGVEPGITAFESRDSPPNSPTSWNLTLTAT